MMLQVGVTGGIGSGKSVVCTIFSLLGVPVFHADSEARKIMNRNEEIRMKITAAFGGEICKDGEMDRQKLASLVFSDPSYLTLLNSIVHPAVFEAFDRWKEFHRGDPYVIKEAAILFESGADEGLDYIICVTAPEALRLQRVVERDGTTRQEVINRMKNQINDADRTRKSDFIIRNDGKEMLLPQVLQLHSTLLSLAGKT